MIQPKICICNYTIQFIHAEYNLSSWKKFAFHIFILTVVIVAKFNIAICWGDRITLKKGIALEVEDIIYTYKGIKFLRYKKVERYSYDEIEDIVRKVPNKLLEAKSLASKGELGKAKAAYIELLKYRKPSVVEEARIGLMECFIGLGDIESAFDSYMSVLADNPDTAFFSRFPLSVDRAEAERLVNFIRKKKPSLEGKFLAQMADVVECYALITAKKELQSVPEKIANIGNEPDERLSSLAKILEAQYLFSQGKYEQSLKFIRDNHDEFNRFTLPLAHFWRGKSLFELGHYDKATLAFLKIPILYKDFHQLACGALFMSAQCFGRLGDLKKAADLCHEMLSRFPFSKSWVTQAKRYLEKLGE